MLFYLFTQYHGRSFLSEELEYPKFASQLTGDEIDFLISVSLCLNDCFRHDTISKLSAVRNGLEIIESEPDGLDPEALDLVKSAMESLSRTLGSFAGIRTFHETLTCDLEHIVSVLKNEFAEKVVIEFCHDSLMNGRVCFPTNILYWIILELGTNALRHGSGADLPKISVTLQPEKIEILTENSVHVVDDNVPSKFQPVTSMLYRPNLPFVTRARDGRGLDVIARILRFTNTKFMAKSVKPLSKYAFFIEIPMLGYFDENDILHRNTIND